MKYLIAAIAAITILFAMSSIVNPAKAVTTEALGQRLCQAVANDDKKRFRAALFESSNKVRTLFSDLRCNDKDILRFAYERDSHTVGSYIVSRLRLSQLEGTAADLDKNSPIGQALAKRLSR
ncbi:MAG: DUF3718 domain-containing protein [Aestuariibacter sp.]|nr:DUF3718 domain-containing protein [Aestuariibacter sp.]